MELRIQLLSVGWKAIIPAQGRSLSLSWNDCFLPLENQAEVTQHTYVLLL